MMAWLFLAGLSSCVTGRKAYRWLDVHAFDASRYCAESFPCTAGPIIPGKPEQITDTLYLPADSVECPDVSGTDVGKKMPCPPGKIIRTYVHTTDTLPVLDSAALVAERGRNDSLMRELINQSARADKAEKGQQEWKSKARTRGWTIYGFIIAIGLGAVGFFLIRSKLI